jgi:hypothetical protein
VPLEKKPPNNIGGSVIMKKVNDDIISVSLVFFSLLFSKRMHVG